VTEAIDDGADLEWAAEAAVRHRTGPLLWRALGMAGLGDREDLLGGRLRANADLWRVQTAMLLPDAVAAAVRPLTDAGLEPLIFKGPALADRYPEPGLRPMDDIDLILPSAQHPTALALLERAGWKVLSERAGVHYDTYLSHPKLPGLPLELHWDVALWRDRANRLRGKAMWRRRTPTSCFGVGAFGLPIEEELVALAAHAGKPFHHFQRLIWSVDISVVINHAGGSLDWDRLRHTARRDRCGIVLAVALNHARRLGVAVPDALAEVPSGRTRQAILSPLLHEAWPLTDPDPALRHQLRYALSDSWGRQAMLVVGEVTEGKPWHIPRATARLTRSASRRWRTLHRD
jgi:hypothetical protein